MPPSAWTLDRSPVWQLVLAAVGVVAFCLYARSWKDLPHLIYDVVAGAAVFSFIAQLLLEVIKDGGSWFWAGRFVLLAAMTIVTTGREFLHWGISGHLSCALAVALVQTADFRLAPTERALYWIPIPVVLLIRWYLFDRGYHWQTYNAVIFAIAGAVPIVLLARHGLTR